MSEGLGLGTVSTVSPPEAWQQLLGLPYDYHPWIGWNVPEVSRLSELGFGLAMQCAAVKARDIAKSGMYLWKLDLNAKHERWDKIKPNEHPFARLLARRPNQYHTWNQFWTMVLLHYGLTGNAYILIDRNRRGDVVQLLPIQPARVQILISKSGRLFYEIAIQTEFEAATIGAETTIVVADSSMIHLTSDMLDGVKGISPLVIGGKTFDLVGSISGFQSDLFSNNGRMQVAFGTDREFGNADLANAAFARLKSQLAIAARKYNETGEPILLEAGLKPYPLGNNAKDSLTTDSYTQQLERICGLMHVPPHKIYHYGNGAKYSNMAEADNQYASDCLIPIADGIEDAFRLTLLPEDQWEEYWPEFDRERMTSSDTAATNERIKIGLTTGAMMINEARERLSLNPIEGGDKLLIPVNMALMDEDGKITQQAAAGQMGAPGAQQAVQPDNGERAKLLKLVSDT